jgi:Nif-specific regulatory protein
VRVIAATNRDLEEAVQAKEFRADLYYRLRVIEIFIPPLRERMEDVPQLVEHFLDQLRHHAGRRLKGISPAALEMLTRHSWPGNVRELRNVIERAIVLGGSSVIEPEDLSLSSLNAEPPATTDGRRPETFRAITLAELELEHILAMLDYTAGNKTKASQLLGIERSTLDRKLKRFGQMN